MPNTTHLGLKLFTSASDLFRSFREGIAGQGATAADKSNMEKIDEWASNVDNSIANIRDNLPIVTAITSWNQETHTYVADLQLPAPAQNPTIAQEIVYIFTVPASGAATFSAPAGYILGDEDGYSGVSSGNEVIWEELTPGNIFEISFKVQDATHIKMIYDESEV